MILNIFFYFLVVNNNKNRILFKKYMFDDLSKHNELKYGYDQRFNNTELENNDELYKIKEYFYKKDILNKLQSNIISNYEKLKIIENNDILKKKNPFDDIIEEFNKEFNKN